MRWFRIYSEILDDEKVQMLSPELFRTWINLLCVAATRDGVFPTVEKLAFKLRLSTHDMQSKLEDLVLSGLIDIRPDGHYEPHNWQQRQWKSDDSAERVRKHRDRKRHCNDDVTVTVTPPESESDTDTDTYGLKSSSVATRAKVKDQGFLSDVLGGRRDDGRTEKLTRRAEGLGIPVDELTEAVNRHKAKNRPAYFTTLCVQWLQDRLPGLDEKIIRDGLWSDDAKYGALLQLAMRVA